MVVCVSAQCRRTFDDVCLFCPFCGADNRPPHHRTPILAHTHEFISGGTYCWRCGEPDEDTSRRQTDAQRGKLFTVIGALVIGIAIVMAAVASSQDDAMYQRVAAERQRLRASGKLEANEEGPKFHFSPLGAYPILICIAGGAVTVYGAVLWINSRKQNEAFE